MKKKLSEKSELFILCVNILPFKSFVRTWQLSTVFTFEDWLFRASLSAYELHLVSSASIYRSVYYDCGNVEGTWLLPPWAR